MNIQRSLQSKHIFFFVILLILSVLGIKALIHPGLYTAHDIWHQVARLYHYQQTAFGGQFPPYWVSNLANGFGYPLFFFSYHLPWIVSLPLLKIGISIPDTIKVLFISSYILSGIFTYIFCFQLFKNKMAAFVSSVLYLWAPYHFVLIFVSAAIGQMFVFMFLPLVLLGILKRNITIIALSFAGCILSHLMTTISLLPLIALFIILSGKTKKYLNGFVLGVGISSFYLIPAVYYSRLTQISTGAFSQLYKKHFVDLSQLIYSKWGYGIADTAKEMNISFQIGIAQWIAFILCFMLAIASTAKQSHLRLPRRFLLLAMTIIFLFTFNIFLMIDASRPLWGLVSNFITLDYPTMFLLPATFVGSFAGGLAIYILKGKLQILVSVFLILIALYTNRNHLRVNEYTYIPVKEYIGAEMTTNSFNEYLPKTADNKLLAEPVPSQTHHFSFPGVNLYIDGIKIDYETDDRGRVVSPEVAKNKNVFINFEDTNLIKVSKLITIASIIIVVLTIWQRRKIKLLQ